MRRLDSSTARLIACADRTQRPGTAYAGVMDPAVVDVAFEERYWYPHDGGVVWVSGYQLVDRNRGATSRVTRNRSSPPG